MQIIIVNSAQAVARKGAVFCSELLKENPHCVLGLATGSTPIALYKELISQCFQKEVSFKHVHSFNLDEYIGIEPTHSQSYRYFMNSHFFDHIDIALKNPHVPDGARAISRNV